MRNGKMNGRQWERDCNGNQQIVGDISKSNVGLPYNTNISIVKHNINASKRNGPLVPSLTNK
jgi:hypothetical protein